jgi:hypothetical protein
LDVAVVCSSSALIRLNQADDEGQQVSCPRVLFNLGGRRMDDKTIELLRASREVMKAVVPQNAAAATAIDLLARSVIAFGPRDLEAAGLMGRVTT